jgi:selenocysteine-specific elongation factor
MTGEAFDAVTRAVQRMLRNFHAQYPELSGLDGEKLYAALESVHGAGGVSMGDFKELLGMLAAKNAVAPVAVQGKTCYRAVDFHSSMDDKLAALVERVKAALASAGFNLLKAAELEEKLNAPPADVKRAAAYLREREELWTTADGLLIARAVRDKLLAVLTALDDITVGALRDAIGVNRKYALSMLDFLDIQKLTQRVGDKRILVEHNTSITPP